MRDVRFINKLNPDNKYEDIVCNQTNNGKFKILGKLLAETSDNQIEIRPSINSDLEYPDNIEDYI